MKRLILLAGVIVAAGGAGAFSLWHPDPSADPVWQGYAEADYVNVSPTLTGRLTSLAVARGDQVGSGALLFTQDAVDDRAALAAARNQLAEAEANLANLQQPRRPMEIAQAEAALAQQRATEAQMADNLARDEPLVGGGFVTAQKIAQEQTQLAGAKAAVGVAAANLALEHEPMGRPDAIAADRAAVEAARNAVQQAEWRLEQRRVRAPVGGVVTETDALEGETVGAGATVVRLLPPGNIRVRFFVSEPTLGSLRWGEPVAIACAGCAPHLTARISYIAPQAEYTPPLIYSQQTEATLVFMIEARPPAGQALQLKPGQPVEVRPLAGTPSS